MLEIKTVSNRSKSEFDEEVNTALRNGWDLVRRECLIVGMDHTPVLYAELERVVEEAEEEEDHSTDYAEWLLTRNPREPYRCSACGCTTNRPGPTCPDCDRIMH